MKLFNDDAFAVATIWAEARGESFAGKLAVAEVILNRTRRSYNSNGTIIGTCLAPVQFSCWNAKDRNRLQMIALDSQDTVVQACESAWRTARAGSQTVKGAVLYYSPSTLGRLGIDFPTWADPLKSQHVATVGNHEFFVPLV